MQRILVASVVALALAAGCKDTTKPGPMAGHWAGSFYAGATVWVDLHVSESGSDLGGSGTITGGTLTAQVVVAGTYTPPTVSLTLRITGYQASVIDGTINAADTEISGNITGSGFAGQAVTLTKQ